MVHVVNDIQEPVLRPHTARAQHMRFANARKCAGDGETRVEVVAMRCTQPSPAAHHQAGTQTYFWVFTVQLTHICAL